MPGLAQERAGDALRKIQDLARSNRYGKYDSYINGFPAAILMNGLGQAAATLVASAKLAKDERTVDHEAYEHLYRHLSSWLCRNDPQAPYPAAADLLVAITQNDEDAYLLAQSEAMAYLAWLKKFSNAYLGS